MYIAPVSYKTINSHENRAILCCNNKLVKSDLKPLSQESQLRFTLHMPWNQVIVTIRIAFDEERQILPSEFLLRSEWSKADLPSKYNTIDIFSQRSHLPVICGCSALHYRDGANFLGPEILQMCCCHCCHWFSGNICDAMAMAANVPCSTETVAGGRGM